MKKPTNPCAIIVGATSGIGYEVALLLLKAGYRLGIAGRREENLKALQAWAPEQIVYRKIDIRQAEAAQELSALIEELGGMDLYLHSSGIGFQNFDLNQKVELDTLETNGTGFVRMVTCAFHYFLQQGHGHLAAISSIAGTKGLGIAPAYSATKRFQNTYLDALEQLSHMHRARIYFTDIRPGFVATSLLNDGKHYPLLMSPAYTARRIVSALAHKKRIAVIDWRYQVLVFFWRLIPAWLWKRLPIRNG